MEGRSSKWVVCLNEVKTVSLVAAPMVVVTVLQFLVQFVATMMVGHLDQLSLSAASIGAAFSLVTGFTVLAGMAGGLETLCGQAYGAEQYHKLGTYMYSAITSMTLVCFPISILWIFTDKFLILAGQDHLISVLARKYSICLVPGLFGSAMLQAMTRYFQTQSLILPMLFASLATMCFHVPLCWFLVFKTGLRYLGAALAVSISTWANVILLVIYMSCSSRCAKTLSKSKFRDLYLGTGEFLRFAIPSAMMTCLEWWSYDLLILLAGLLPNPKLESSVISICFSITYLHYYIPYGFGATISTRVSNELGAGKPKAAKMAVQAVMILAVMELAVVILPLFLCRHILGGCEGKWEAELGSFRESWSLLHSWDTIGCCIGICCTFERERVVDWLSNRIRSASNYVCSQNLSHRLGTAGMASKARERIFQGEETQGRP
ncbi:Protein DETOXIFICATION 14 [Linum grandiflorum]